MSYSVDLKNISIDDFKEMLKNIELIPSWKILEKDIKKNLNIIKKQNVHNLDELLVALKDKDKIHAFSNRSSLADNYLSVLKRVVNGYRRKPNRIKDFPCVSENVINQLEKVGIKNTIKLYGHIVTEKKRKALSKKTGIRDQEMMMLVKLTDLSRIRWANHTFAYVLLEAGYDTAEKVANADYKEIYDTVKQLNSERKIYNAHIGVNDMKMLVEAAKMLDFEIAY